jgi:hypothetical protein
MSSYDPASFSKLKIRHDLSFNAMVEAVHVCLRRMLGVRGVDGVVAAQTLALKRGRMQWNADICL